MELLLYYVRQIHTDNSYNIYMKSNTWKKLTVFVYQYADFACHSVYSFIDFSLSTTSRSRNNDRKIYLPYYIFSTMTWCVCPMRILIVWVCECELISFERRFVLIWFDSVTRAQSNGRETSSKNIGLFYFSSSIMPWCVCIKGIIQRNGFEIRNNFMVREIRFDMVW